MVKFKVLRSRPSQEPTFKTYDLEISEPMTVLQILQKIHDEIDRTLAFRRYSCGIWFCGSCVMVINGNRERACTRVVKPDEEVEVRPLPEP